MIEKKSSQKFSTFHFVRNAEKQTALSQRTGKQINFECPQAQDNPPWLTILEASVNAHKNHKLWSEKKNHLNQTLTQHNVSVLNIRFIKIFFLMVLFWMTTKIGKVKILLP